MAQESETKPRPLPKPHLTPLELSLKFGVSQSTLYRWRSDGKRITYQVEGVQARLLSEQKEVLARAGDVKAPSTNKAPKLRRDSTAFDVFLRNIAGRKIMIVEPQAHVLDEIEHLQQRA